MDLGPLGRVLGDNGSTPGLFVTIRSGKWERGVTYRNLELLSVREMGPRRDGRGGGLYKPPLAGLEGGKDPLRADSRLDPSLLARHLCNSSER